MGLNVTRTLQQWVERFRHADYPVLENTHNALVAIEKGDSDIGGAAIAASVRTDPLMVLKVMRMANSGRNGRFAQPVSTMENALMLIGPAPGLWQMLDCNLVEQVVPPAPQAGLMQVVARAYHAAFQAREWALFRLDLNSEEVYIAALLQEIAELILWTTCPETMQSLPSLRQQLGREEAERTLLGCTCDELTLTLSEVWNLPSLMTSAQISTERQAHPRARLVCLAKRLARHAECGWYHEDLQQDMDELAALLHLRNEDVAGRVHRISVAAARSRIFAGVTPAAAWLPMLPDDESNDCLLNAAELPLTEANATSLQSKENIALHLDDTSTLHDLMQKVMRSIKEEVGLERAAFALLSEDNTQLRARYVTGVPEGAALRQFRFGMNEDNLFTRMLSRQQAFWLNPETRARVRPLLTEEVLRVIGDGQFFIMSLAPRGKVIGLIFADRGTSGSALDADSYGKFKALCGSAVLGMERLARG